MEIGRQFPDVDWIASPESEQHLGPEKQGGGRETEIGKTSNVVSSVEVKSVSLIKRTHYEYTFPNAVGFFCLK